MRAADCNFLFPSSIHLMVSVLLSARKHVSQGCRSGLFFNFGTINSYWCVCSYCFFWEPPLLIENVWWKLCIRARYDFMKSFWRVFLLTWPRPHMFEGTLLQAFPFWTSFFWVLLFLFHFQPSYISSKFKRPFFLLWFWLEQFLFFVWRRKQ